MLRLSELLPFGLKALCSPRCEQQKMMYLIIKAALSGVIVMIVSEVARRSPGIALQLRSQLGLGGKLINH